jgi:hypothetical protein
MTKIAFPLTLLATTLVCSLLAIPAQAQTRTYTAVSSAAIPGVPKLPGPTSTSCGSIQSPCATLQAALAVTANGGEIDVLDPGEYGPATISRAVNIQGHGWTSIIAAGGANAITIGAANGDRINIRGVLLDGQGTGTTGIEFNRGAALNIQDSSIRNFSASGGFGIYFNPGGPSLLTVSNTVVSDSTNGIGMNNASSATVNGVLDHVTVVNNATDGISVADSQAGIFAYLMVRNSTIVGNGTGLVGNGASATIIVFGSTVFANTTGWAQQNGSTVLSYCSNMLDYNPDGGDGSPNGFCQDLE